MTTSPKTMALIWMATGALLSLLIGLAIPPTQAAPETVALDERLSRIEALVMAHAEASQRGSMSVEQAIRRLEEGLDASTMARNAVAPADEAGWHPSDQPRTMDDAAYLESLPKTVRELLVTRGVSPTASQEVREAVDRAAEVIRAASERALEALRNNPGGHFSEQEAYRNRVTTIRVEQQQAAMDALGYFLDEYLKPR